MKTFYYDAPSANAKNYFDEHGWILFKNVFSKAEIKKMRQIANEMQSENHKGDIFSHPKISSVIYDERIIALVKTLLDTEKPVYFGDSNCLIGARTTPFHKDNPDRTSQMSPDWQTPYTILRMGIYMQDHKYHSEGLALRDRSHNTVSVKEGRLIYVPTEPGDLVVWSLRTTHAGTAVRFRFAPNYFPHERIYWKLQRKLPKFLFLPVEQNRIAFFISYAKLEDNHLQRFINYSKTRTDMIELWSNSHYDSKEIKRAEQFLKIIDLSDAARKTDISKTSSNHMDLAY